jgi:predicted ATPase
VDDSVVDKIGGSMNFMLKTMIKNYGSDMQAYSHGEAYLTILQKRIQIKGVYILDEPEAALSPLKQWNAASRVQRNGALPDHKDLFG